LFWFATDVSLNEFLGIPIVESFEEVASHAASRSSRDGMTEHESFEAVRPVGLTVDHVQHFLRDALGSGVSHGPIVSCATTFRVHIDVFGIVEVAMIPRANLVDHAGFEVDQNRTGDILVVVGLVEEHILAVAAFTSKILDVPVPGNTTTHATHTQRRAQKETSIIEDEHTRPGRSDDSQAAASCAADVPTAQSSGCATSQTIPRRIHMPAPGGSEQFARLAG
jgi:hypothetical protein